MYLDRVHVVLVSRKTKAGIVSPGHHGREQLHSTSIALQWDTSRCDKGSSEVSSSDSDCRSTRLEGDSSS